MQLLRDLADRATVLHYGRKLAEGSPQDVVSDTRVIESLSNPLFP
jgi:ABC-type branched-subunit amino acid transport system ATPase component